MRRLVEFIRSIYVVVLFVLLEIAAVSYYARSTAYTEARLLARTNSMVGGLNKLVTDIGNFFLLGRENRALTARIATLEETGNSSAGRTSSAKPFSPWVNGKII